MPTKVLRDDPPSCPEAKEGSLPDEDLTTPVNTRVITFDNSTGLQSASFAQTELFPTETPSVENKNKRKRFNYKPQDKHPLSSLKRKSLRKYPPLVNNSLNTPRTNKSANHLRPTNNGQFVLEEMLAHHHAYISPELDNYDPVLGSICDGAAPQSWGFGSQHSAHSAHSKFNIRYHHMKATTPNTNNRALSNRSSVMSDLTSVPNHAPVNLEPVFGT